MTILTTGVASAAVVFAILAPNVPCAPSEAATCSVFDQRDTLFRLPDMVALGYGGALSGGHYLFCPSSGVECFYDDRTA
ncbi:MAG TPA: hypothetical protein VLX56_00135 [Nitrososphaerales archaeon]|nr:hypothetical protein [Nitrososphaerales archaeon]